LPLSVIDCEPKVGDEMRKPKTKRQKGKKWWIPKFDFVPGFIKKKKLTLLDSSGTVMRFAWDDDGIFGLRCHIAVAVSITWIALHSVYVLWSFGDPHFVFGEENGHFHFFKMDSFSWGV
jgi:hypothetical protein